MGFDDDDDDAGIGRKAWVSRLNVDSRPRMSWMGIWMDWRRTFVRGTPAGEVST